MQNRFNSVLSDSPQRRNRISNKLEAILCDIFCEIRKTTNFRHSREQSSTSKFK